MARATRLDQYDRMSGNFFVPGEVESSLKNFVNHTELVRWARGLRKNEERRVAFDRERYAYRVTEDLKKVSDIYDVRVFGHFEFTPAILAPDLQSAVLDVLGEMDDWVGGICMNGKLKVWID